MEVLEPSEKSKFIDRKLEFKHLPAYAQYVLDNRLVDFIKEQLRISREIDLPLLKFFAGIPEDQLIEISKVSNTEFLNSVIGNSLDWYITDSMQKWKDNQLQLITSEQVIAEDITFTGYMRKGAFAHFLSDYTQDIKLALSILAEIDEYFLKSETIGFKIFIGMQQEHQLELNKQLEQKQSELFEAQAIANVGSFEWDLATQRSTFSPQFGKIFNLDESRGLDTFLEYVHPDDRANITTGIDNALSKGNIFEATYRYQKDDDEKIIWSRGVVSYNGDQPIAMRGTIVDVTEREKTIKELKDKETLYKQAQALTHIGNWTWHVQKNKVTWSDEMYRIYGLEPQSEEITFERFTSLMHPEDRERRIQQIQQSLATKTSPDYAIRIVRPSGEIVVLQGRGEMQLDDRGEPLAMIGTCQDVTAETALRTSIEQKNEELRISEERYQRMINEVQDYAIILLNKEGIIQNWNLGAEKIKGYKASEIVGKSFHTFYRQVDRDNNLPEMLLHTATTEGKASQEGWRVRKDGTTFWGSILITALHDDNNEVIGFSKVTRDLTEMKFAEDRLLGYMQQLEEREHQLVDLNQALEQKNIELERSNKELSSFNYIASHDLQEPLRKIKTFANLIIDSENLSEKSQVYFGKIGTAATRMQQLIEDLLAFSRTNIDTEEFELVNLNDILAETKNSYDDLISSEQLVFEADQLPVIKGLSFQMHQLFNNIISNSIKYRKEDVVPHVQVRTRKVLGSEIKLLGPEQNSEYYEVSISDNGIGFDAKYANKVFEIFQRLHGMEYKGTGIGLAICKKIIQNHHGFILAESAEGEGATFRMYIPV